MKNRIAAIQAGLLLLLTVFLNACGAGKQEQTAKTAAEPMPVPVITAAPLQEITFPDGSVHKTLERRVDLSALSHEEVPAAVEALKQMPKLRYINLGTEDDTGPEKERGSAEESVEGKNRGLTWEDIRAMQEACPESESALPPVSQSVPASPHHRR